jgi:hypothetical protein
LIAQSKPDLWIAMMDVERFKSINSIIKPPQESFGFQRLLFAREKPLEVAIANSSGGFQGGG